MGLDFLNEIASRGDAMRFRNRLKAPRESHGPHPEEHRAAMRLEGWPQVRALPVAILRDAVLRTSPQDEGPGPRAKARDASRPLNLLAPWRD